MTGFAGLGIEGSVPMEIKSGAVAQGRMVCYATKIVPLRKAVAECDLTSFRKRRAHIGDLCISDGVGRGVFSV